MKTDKSVYTIIYIFLGIVFVALLYMIIQLFSPKEPYIDLSQLKPVSKIKSTSENNSNSLHFAVATMWSIESTFSMYQRLVHRIGRDVGLKDSFILRQNYGALRTAIEQDEVDVAFVCTGPYIYSLPSGKIKLLAQPEFTDGHRYHSVLIVNSKSSANSFEDLKGTVIGYADPESFTGYLVPYVKMDEEGINPNTFFEKIIFTGSHDRSIHAVDREIVNAAAVHSVVLESAKREDPTLMDRIKVIWSSETFGPPPVIVSKNLDEKLVNALNDAFLNLDKDKEGREILSSIGIERFVPAREEDYKSALELYERFSQIGEEN